MNGFQDRRVLLAVGAGAAVLAGILIAVFFSVRAGPRPADTGTQGSLKVETMGEDGKIDPTRPLRCFVGGQFAGQVSLGECAKRNGVAAQNLDVGLDQTGALAAASNGETVLKPLPPAPTLTTTVAPPVGPIQSPPTIEPPTPVPNVPVATTPVPTAGPPVGDCLRFAGGGWRGAGGTVSLNACVHILFEGRCERPGGATYGRWGAQTLRLVPGKVEASPDNRNFHSLAEQGRDCSIPPV